MHSTPTVVFSDSLLLKEKLFADKKYNINTDVHKQKATSIGSNVVVVLLAWHHA